MYVVFTLYHDFMEYTEEIGEVEKLFTCNSGAEKDFNYQVCKFILFIADK